MSSNSRLIARPMNVFEQIRFVFVSLQHVSRM